jgi:hypothetical protein
MTKIDKIEMLIDLSNSSDNAFVAFKAKLAEMPMFGDAMKEKFAEAFDAAKASYRAEQIAIYDKWFSEGAIDAFITFYSSEYGQEIINNMPHVINGLANVSTKMIGNIFANLGQKLYEAENAPDDFDSTDVEEDPDWYDNEP